MISDHVIKPRHGRKKPGKWWRRQNSNIRARVTSAQFGIGINALNDVTQCTMLYDENSAGWHGIFALLRACPCVGMNPNWNEKGYPVGYGCC
jgi:hypothetical protein